MSTPEASPSPSEAKIITLICDEKCKDSEVAKLKMIEKKLNDTLGGKCFEDFMSAPERTFTHTIYSGLEVVKQMRAPATMLVNYYTSVNVWVMGYEVAGESVVHLNRLALAYHGSSLCDEASTAAHETSHAKGFMHAGNDPRKNNNLKSVPYQINAAFEACCK